MTLARNVNRIRREPPVVARRQFLRAGGISVGLPFLASLFPRRASGQDLVPQREPRFVALSPFFSAVRPDNFFPADSVAGRKATLLPGMDIHHGELGLSTSGANASVSAVLTAPKDRFSSELLRKMNVVNGIDIPFYCPYHKSGWLGNFNNDVTSDVAPTTATLDQVLGWSPSVYPAGQNIVKRVISFGDSFPISFGYRDAPARSGAIVAMPYLNPETASTRPLFEMVIGDNAPAKDRSRKQILDRVFARYQSLRQSNRRISAQDRVVLDNHIAQLRALEKRLGNQSAQCTRLGGTPPQDSREVSDRGLAGFIRRYQLCNDIIAASFACGTSRIATLGIMRSLVDYMGNYHQDVEHHNREPFAQSLIVKHHQAMFSEIFLDLINKLNVPAGNGATLLDGALVQWGIGHGYHLYNTNAMPLVTAGSLGGRLRTGSYFDFRNRARELRMGNEITGNPGLHINRWFRGVLDGFGVPPSEYADLGYDKIYNESTHAPYRAAYVAGQHESRVDRLPEIFR